MGKATKYTGSLLLGRELRRLRGGRSLKQIAELSKSPPLCHRVNPISAPTLSQIENGISFPTLESVYTLASVYQVSTQSLLDTVAQERIAERVELPTDEAELNERFVEAYHGSRWNEGLALALLGERTASDESDRVAWRARRANCLKNVGMRLEAIGMLMESLEEPSLEPAQRARILRSLAEASASSGHLTTALLFAREAVEALPSDIEPRRRWPFVATECRVLLILNDRRDEKDERALRRVVRELENVLADMDADDVDRRLQVEVFIAVARRHLGNLPLAQRDLERIAAHAKDGGHRGAQLAALANLGLVLAQRRSWAKARSALTEAAFLAVDDERYQEAFELHFELFRLADRRGDSEAAQHLKTCRRYFPLVQDKSPNVLAFQKLEEAP